MEENKEPEIWKPIPDYEGLYEVSSWGNVRSLDRLTPSGNGAKHLHKGKVLKINKCGAYPQICLSAKNIIKSFRVHKVIDKVFFDVVPYKYIVNHKDSDKTNNYIGNLERVNNRENSSHFFINNFNKTSKYVGVSYDKSKPKKPWAASICHDKKSIKICNCSTEEEAYAAYLSYLKKSKLKNKYS